MGVPAWWASAWRGKQEVLRAGAQIQAHEPHALFGAGHQYADRL